MQPITEEIYSRIDNSFYNAAEDIWWQEDSFLSLLRSSFNPCRFSYFIEQFNHLTDSKSAGSTLLDIGCGGGLLAEEFAMAGFSVTGIDPAENSVRTAAAHARKAGLNIRYEVARAEQLPYPSDCFDAVSCCDVLEHVRDLRKSISEISRVLKPGGVFFFDTINRTPLSKLIVIKLWQEWKWTALVQPGLHVYEMFIRPSELRDMCAARGLSVMHVSGMSPNVNPLRLVSLLMQRAKGKLSYTTFGEKVKMVSSNDLHVGYMGYALKEAEQKNRS